MDFEIIDETEVKSVSRGRKSMADPELIQALAKLPKGKFVRLTSYKCDPKSDSFTKQKATRSAQIRSAGSQAGVKVEIRWSPDGIPQVCKVEATTAKK